MTKKFFELTTEEQTRWVNEFAEWKSEGYRLAAIKKGWTRDDTLSMEKGLRLLEVWPYCAEICEKARKYGDYASRAYRLPAYIGRIQADLAAGLTITDADGKTLVQVQPSTPLRRRGRPSREEAYAKLHGKPMIVQGEDNAEARRRKAIAKALGMEVIVAGEPPREKNNDELRAERKERERKEREMNPPLFEERPEDIAAAMESMKIGSVSESLPSLQQLKWLMSPEVAQMVDRVAELRNLRAAESERAKTMSDMGAKEKDIEPHTKATSEADEQLADIFDAIDRDLAEVNYRLKLDETYPDKLRAKYKDVDIPLLIKTTNRYLAKMCEEQPTFMQAMQDKVDAERPERVAEREKAEAEKKEVSELCRYIKRTDKGPSDERVATMTKRIERLRELRGDEFADAFLPILEKTKRDNKAMHEEAASKAAEEAKGPQEKSKVKGQRSKAEGKTKTKTKTTKTKK